MTQNAAATATKTQVTPAVPALLTLAKPDRYELSGGGITVTYLPTGAGGLAHLEYQDAGQTLNFTGDQIRTVAVPDLGTIVSVTIRLTVDTGSTTFSVVLPDVSLPSHVGASTTIHTDGITTVHRFSLLALLNIGQREIYTYTPMSGTASIVIIPL